MKYIKIIVINVISFIGIFGLYGMEKEINNATITQKKAMQKELLNKFQRKEFDETLKSQLLWKIHGIEILPPEMLEKIIQPYLKTKKPLAISCFSHLPSTNTGFFGKFSKLKCIGKNNTLSILLNDPNFQLKLLGLSNVDLDNLDNQKRKAKCLLYWATRLGSKPLLKKLIEEKKLNPNGTGTIYDGPSFFNEANSLYVAVQYNKNEIIDYLLQQPNINCNILDNNQKTVLSFAIKRNNLKLTKQLLQAGAHADTDKTSCKAPLKTPLRFAIENGVDLPIVISLVTHGANKNSINIHNETALNYAISMKKTYEKKLQKIINEISYAGIIEYLYPSAYKEMEQQGGSKAFLKESFQSKEQENLDRQQQQLTEELTNKIANLGEIITYLEQT